MPGEMCDCALNLIKFLHHVSISRIGKAPKKKLVLKKLIAYYFFVLTIVECGPFEGGAKTNLSNTFLPNRTLLGSSGYFLKLNTSS